MAETLKQFIVNGGIEMDSQFVKEATDAGIAMTDELKRRKTMQKLTFEENLKNRMEYLGVNADDAVLGFLHDHDQGLIAWEQYDETTVEVKEDGAEPYLMVETELYKFWQQDL